jgi:cytidylate kinase
MVRLRSAKVAKGSTSRTGSAIDHRGRVIAIDGPVGSGKSTVARLVAEKLGYTYVDSGAMYRAVAVAAIEGKISPREEEAISRLAASLRVDLKPEAGALRVFVNGKDVTDRLRGLEVSQATSQLSQYAGVRAPMVAEQRRAAEGNALVMEGRDIGTVVFPDAELKIYLDASAEERARRRLAEYEQRGERIELAQMEKEIQERDKRDAGRKLSPLRAARDAIYVDTTAISAEEAAELIVFLMKQKETA